MRIKASLFVKAFLLIARTLQVISNKARSAKLAKRKQDAFLARPWEAEASTASFSVDVETEAPSLEKQ